MGLTLSIHVIAGLLGLLSGGIALYAAKGGRLHRKSGKMFVSTMLAMCVTGFTVATVRDAAPEINVPAAILTAYLVTTALIAVRPRSAATRRLTLLATLVGLAVGLSSLTLGIWALASPAVPNGFAFPLFLFGSVGLAAAIGDVKVLRSSDLPGPRRLRRHLWRMCFALFIGALSFFVGQADVFPPPIRIRPLLALPPFVVLVTMLYWMRRTKIAPLPERV